MVAAAAHATTVIRSHLRLCRAGLSYCCCVPEGSRPRHDLADPQTAGIRGRRGRIRVRQGTASAGDHPKSACTEDRPATTVLRSWGMTICAVTAALVCAADDNRRHHRCGRPAHPPAQG